MEVVVGRMADVGGRIWGEGAWVGGWLPGGSSVQARGGGAACLVWSRIG